MSSGASTNALRLAARMARLGTEGAFEVLARAKALEAQGRSVVHLEIGEPDFDTPAHITEAAVKALRDGFTHYVPAAGIPEAREAVAEYIFRTRGIEVGPDHVVLTPGGKPVMFFLMLALVDPGDEVICPDPGSRSTSRSRGSSARGRSRGRCGRTGDFPRTRRNCARCCPRARVSSS